MEIHSNGFANLQDVIVFDVETTGLSPVSDRIVRLAALKLNLPAFVEKGGTEIDFVKIDFNPRIPIPAEATRINGIHDRDVENCLTFEEQIDDILSFFGGMPCIAHNCRFDASFLENSFFRAGVRRQIERKYFCTMNAVCSHLNGSGINRTKISLKEACKLFGIQLNRGAHHDALEDAKAAMQLAAAVYMLEPKKSKKPWWWFLS